MFQIQCIEVIHYCEEDPKVLFEDFDPFAKGARMAETLTKVIQKEQSDAELKLIYGIENATGGSTRKSILPAA
ncbi:hypothetical protein [Neptuniibacter sp.]|uniref:hypothetical protein n=1 Tax=Neptuniibacter sp. TaxID=1962643 RepID=UPI002627A848|nr:hypothetical protein [Neptuniibacter sp.]MCP4598665.1 hypothetical protein [Neptuniibacter sp.]